MRLFLHFALSLIFCTSLHAANQQDDGDYILADEWAGSICLLISNHSAGDSFSSVDRPTGFGLLFELQHRSWPLAVEVTFAHEIADEFDFGIQENLTTAQFCVGVKKYFAETDSVFRPFIAGGLSKHSFDYESDTLSYSEKVDATGIYGDAGIDFQNGAFTMGLRLRYTYGDNELPGLDNDDLTQRVIFAIGRRF